MINNKRTHIKNNIAAPRKKRKRISEMGKALIISWIVIFVVSAVIGSGITGLCLSVGTSSEQAVASSPYGTRDGKQVKGELTFAYTPNCHQEFTPIDCALSEDLQEFTFYLCKGYYIDFSFAMAVMFRESSFDIGAVSQDGRDHGLFQIRDINNEWLEEQIGVTNMHDPYENIRAGLYILRRLFEKYDDPAKVLMAYNMGETGAAMLWDNGVLETTFTRRVMVTADEYAAEIKNNIKK